MCCDDRARAVVEIMKTAPDDISAAQRWRTRWGFVGRGGVAVVLGGEVQSWVSQLRTRQDWRPGCVAVDDDGMSWTAIAGNEHTGALMWLPNSPIPE